MIIDNDAICLVATEDIPILKHVIYTLISGKKEYYTIFQDMVIPEDGELIPEEKLSYIPTRINNWGHREIKYGAIHCYTTSMYQDILPLPSDTCPELFDGYYQAIYLKGVIPKGTKYYISNDGKEIAAMRVLLDLSTEYTII